MKLPGVFREEEAAPPTAHSQGCKTGLQNTGAIAEVMAFSHICCLQGNYKHWSFKIFFKGRMGKAPSYDLHEPAL